MATHTDVLFDLVQYVTINPFMHNVKKWPNIFKKSCAVNTASVLRMSDHFSTLCMKESKE